MLPRRILARHGAVRQLVQRTAATTTQCSRALMFPAIRQSLAFNSQADKQRIWQQKKRHFSISSIPAVLLPPTVFVGLVLTLWTWKCFMMVLFQDKIIYMPSVPPFSRSEKTEDYSAASKPITWHEECIRASDGTKVYLCISSPSKPVRHDGENIVLLYFQGNASSLPPRLPMLSRVLKELSSRSTAPSCTLVALSYRGFWKSSGRASERGIRKDATAALERVAQMAQASNARVVLWGQSIGAGVAMDVLLRHRLQARQAATPDVAGIVLETPFTSIRNMLTTLYPQRWLPYRYLWPLLWNHWDNEAAVQRLAAIGAATPMLIVAAGKDEVVPATHAAQLAAASKASGMQCETVVVPNALHHETTVKHAGRQAIVSFVERCAESSPMRRQEGTWRN